MVQLSHPYMTTGKKHSFDYMELCQQSDVSAFKYAVYICHSFSYKVQASFNFMAVITIHSDFGAQENKICHYFHCFPIYLPWSDGTRCYDLRFLNSLYILKNIFFIWLSWVLAAAQRIVTLHYSMQKLLIATYGIQFSDQGLNSCIEIMEF